VTGGGVRATGGGTGSWGAIWCTYRCSNSALMPRIWIFPACRHAILRLLQFLRLPLLPDLAAPIYGCDVSTLGR